MAQNKPLPMQLRAAEIAPASFDAARSAVRVVWTTGARVRRLDPWSGDVYEEELLVSPEAVDMSRFDAGAVQVLDGHQRYAGVSAILGIAERGWIDNGKGFADVRLSQRPELAGIVTDIGAGIIRDISFGYSVERYEITPAQSRTDGVPMDLWRAVRWTPQEISFVPVPADPNAGTRSAQASFPCDFERAVSLEPQQEATMPDTTTKPAEREQEVAEIRSMVTRHRLPAEFADQLVARNLDRQAAGLEILNRLADLDRTTGGHLNVDRNPALARDPGPGGELSARLELMSEALAARIPGGPALKRENAYRGVRVTEMARDLLELRGVRTGGMSTSQIVERALHTTSDFPNLLQGTGERVLRAAYGSYAGGVRRIARQVTNRDFRAKQRLQLGEAPQLLQVNEHGEFKYGTMAEAKESYSLATFGRIFGVTRQALVNDDLDAFGDMAIKLGRAAAEFESKFLADLLLSNPTLGDSLATFHATHGNLGTGAGSALQESSLSTARAAMRLQKGLDGTTPSDATPAYLIVPAALETTAQKLLTAIQATKSSDVNPFGGALELVVEPRLDATSAVAWYLAASPALIDTIEYAYLEGEEGPQVFVREGFEIDGVEMKVREDFGGAILDFRGLYKANGA